jgi:exonuclease VII small subunit
MKKKLKPLIDMLEEQQKVIEAFLAENAAELEEIKALERKGDPWFDKGTALTEKCINHLSVARRQLSKIYEAVPRKKKTLKAKK